MKEFDLIEYEEAITKVNDKDSGKIKIFIEYLYKKYGINSLNEKFDNDYLYLINDDDILESLEYYIAKGRVKSQITANNFLTDVGNFFNELLNEYNIKNETFTDVILREQLWEKSKQIIGNLKESESKLYASDEQFEKLNIRIEKFMSEIVISDIYDEIDRYNDSKDNKKVYVKLYTRFLSIITMKLAMIYGLSNSKILSLKRKDVDIKQNTISISGFIFRLNDELGNLLNTYIEIREYVMKTHSINETSLFIKYTGEKYKKDKSNSRPDYTSFFRILNDTLGTSSAELFSNRRILEMINEGIDINTVAILTGKSEEKCIELKKNWNSEEIIQQNLQKFFEGDKILQRELNIQRKGYLKCPNCNKEVEAISDEWVLVQFENSKRKYLRCKYCRGNNEKNI